MRVEIYTKEDCGYCNMAKTLLKSKNVAYTEYVLSLDFTREQLLEKFSLAKSFPVIVVDGYYIGGYTNLVEHLDKNPIVQVQEVLVEIPEPATPVIDLPVFETSSFLDEVVKLPTKKQKSFK